MVIADYVCSEPDASTSDPVEAGKPFDFPWSYGFESGYCDYVFEGYCASTGQATRKIVDWPVHSGKYAADFTVRAEGGGGQSRCFREGTLPKEAYYGAWYFVPKLAKNTGNWNLFLFQDGDGPDRNLAFRWDVSLGNNDAGNLYLYIFEHSTNPLESGIPHQPTTQIPIPIGEWFHVQLFMRRAADSTGELDLYQDGTNILQLSNISTSNTAWGQWYVGNLATNLDPVESTVYVDDISVESTL